MSVVTTVWGQRFLQVARELRDRVKKAPELGMTLNDLAVMLGIGPGEACEIVRLLKLVGKCIEYDQDNAILSWKCDLADEEEVQPR